MIRGVNKPIITSKSNAEEIDRIWRDKDTDSRHVFRVSTQSFSKSDIKFIDIIPDSAGVEERNREMEEFYESEKKLYAKESAWPVETKARHYDFFRFLFMSCCGRYPTDEEQQKAYPIQHKFFTENPKRRLCDFYLLSPIIPRKYDDLTLFNLGGINLAERAIYRDMQLSGHFKSPYMPKPLVPAYENETIPEAKERIKENREADKEFADLVKNATDNF